MSTPATSVAADIIFPGRPYRHIAFDDEFESRKVAPIPKAAAVAIAPAVENRTAKPVNPERVRVRAYFLWLNQREQYVGFNEIDFWLLAERLEKFYS